MADDIPKRWPDGASAEYISARQQLMEAETALLADVKRVAELRRALPMGPPLPAYTFAEGPRDLSEDEPVVSTSLAELVGDRELVVYHLMFGSDWDEGCPSCSMWVDGLQGVAHHLAQRMNLAVVAKAPLAKLRAWGRERGWHGLRLLSSHDSSFNHDLGAEDDAGNQWPGLSSFTAQDGVVYHRYTTGMMDNSMDLTCAVWHVEDLVPQGRGDWEPSNDYPRI